MIRNGTFTITRESDGVHKTLRVHTQSRDSKFAPGMRVVSLLVGPRNYADYVGFGFVVPNEDKLWPGESPIKLWKAHANDPLYLRLADLLVNRYSHEGKGYTYQEALTCRRCNRLLTTPESIEAGIGPECARRDR